jgi:hypothetical protein
MSIPNTEHLDEKMLVDQLSAQYRLHTEQARAFVGFAGTSLSVIFILITGIFTISRDDNRILLILAPLTLISYAALIGLLFLYVNLNTLYAELIERKINFLLGELPVFQYETCYVAYKDNKGEVGSHYLLVVCAALTPIAPAVYAIWLLGDIISTGLQASLLIAVSFSCSLVSYVLLKVRSSRRKKNDKLLEDWKSQITSIRKQLL